jgi:hypothetical protein
MVKCVNDIRALKIIEHSWAVFLQPVDQWQVDDQTRQSQFNAASSWDWII